MDHPSRALAGTLLLAAGALAQIVPGGASPGRAGATGPLVDQPVYLPAPAFTDVDYTYESVTSHEGQRFHLFEPLGAPPPEGWPVLVTVVLSGFVSLDKWIYIDEDEAITEINGVVNPSGFFFKCLEAGIAVVSASTTVSAGGATVNQPASAFNGGQPGGGVFFPAGWTLGGGVLPYEDLDRPMPEKDLVMLIQYLREHAGTLRIDPGKIVVDGSSGSADVLMWIAFGPDRAGQLDGSSQGLQPTRPNAAIIKNGIINWLTFKEAIVRGPHFAAFAAGPPYDQPALFLDEVWFELRAAASATSYDVGPTFLRNDALPTFMFYDRIPASFDFDEPYELDTEVDVHSARSGYIWKTRHPAATYLMVTPAVASAVGNGLEDIALSGTVDSPSTGDQMFQWLQSILPTL